MNIKEIRGTALKKALGAESASFGYNTKSHFGGSFAMNIRGLHGKDWQLCGLYSADGALWELDFGPLYELGVKLPVGQKHIRAIKDFDHLMEILLKATKALEAVAL